jgi:hypothetical protein
MWKKNRQKDSNSLSQEAHKILIDQQFPGIDILKIYNYSLCSSRGCSSFSAERLLRKYSGFVPWIFHIMLFT